MAIPSLLAGVRVLDLSGPNAQLCGRLIAELGAEVIMVEPPTGDPGRAVGPWASGTEGPEMSLSFAGLNSGKRSVVLDPSAAETSNRLARLAHESDAVILSDLSPWYGHVDTAALVADGRPVVVVRGFGADGPYADYAAPDIVTLALGGLLFISGDPTLPPCAPPEPLGQYFASVWASLALVSGIWATRTHGRAALYELATQEAIATQEHLVRAAAMDGEPIARNGSQHKSVAPATVFPTNDGWVYIYVSRNHWPSFLSLWTPHPEEYDDPRWVPNSARRADAERLNAAVSAWTAGFNSRELVQRLQGGGVPCLPVNRPSDFIDDDQVVARELFESVSHPSFGTFRQVRFPALIDGRRPPATRPPLLGEHDSLLLGTSEEQQA